MIAFRDILIFAGLAALAAAVIASLFPVGEGVSAVPACSDCAFKLTGGYWIRQYGNYASLYLGTREVARYGWAYKDDIPLDVGEAVYCDPMYVHVLSGIAYISCNGSNPVLGRRGSLSGVVSISVDPSRPGCIYTVNVATNRSNSILLEVYDEYGRLVYSASRVPPTTFDVSVPMAGIYHMRVYAPQLLDEWYILYAGVNITGKWYAWWNIMGGKVAVFTSNNTQDITNTPDILDSITLKIFDLTDYWKKDYERVLLYVNNPRRNWWRWSFEAPSNAFADFVLAWEDGCCVFFEPYTDEVWRLTFTPSGPVLTRIYSRIGFEHRVYADGKLIYEWRDGRYAPPNVRYTGSDPTITVKFESVLNNRVEVVAEATFTKFCRWS